MAYDLARQRVVLFGGDSPLRGDTWEWDGTQWRALAVTGPPPRRHHAMAWDPSQARVLLVGGQSAPVDASTWMLGATVGAESTVFGAGCAGSAGVPRLAPFGEPALGNGCFAFDLGSARPNAPVFVLVAARSASIGFGPCTLLVDPATSVVLPATTNTAGFTVVATPIPMAPTLLGSIAYAQGLVLDPAGAFGLLAATAGVGLKLGE